MKLRYLKVTVLGLLMPAAFMILTGLSNTPRSLAQDKRPSIAPAAPTERKVEAVFTNIKVLNGMPESQLYPAMRFMAASLGFQCGSCHVFKSGQLDSAADDKPEKRTARDMIRMVQYINKTFGQDNPTVSCYTCHRGQNSPQAIPTLPLPLPSPRSTAAGGGTAGRTGANSPGASNNTKVLPSADDILSKYMNAIGGSAAVDQIHSCVIKGSITVSSGQFVPYEAEVLPPDKAYESLVIQGRTVESVINGSRAWSKTGAGMMELTGQQLVDKKTWFPLFVILRLKDQYSRARVSGENKIDDRDVYVVSSVRSDNKRARLFFDAETGLLRRQISYTLTMIGTIPDQTDFEDYREVNGLKLPFTITVSSFDARTPPIARRFAEIKLNVSVDDSKFHQPRP